MIYTQTLQKWGNGEGIRLPKKVREATGLKPGVKVNVTVKNGAVVLTPVDNSKIPRRMTLDELLKGMTPEIVGGEYDWGPDVGVERWYDHEG